jgi:S1-C subfamily serine protease
MVTAAVCLLMLTGLACGVADLAAAVPAVRATAAAAIATPATAQAAPGTALVTEPTSTQVATRAPVVLDEQEAANALEDQVIAVYEAASPSVVNVTNRSTVYSRFQGAEVQEGTGSGFVYDTDGHILTNYHVIENADELLVTLAGGQVYPADVVGQDPASDLAVLQIDAGDQLPPPLTLGDSNTLRVGQFVVAIGNPYGLERTLTTGVVSALGRVIEGAENNQFIGEAIQTDAAINPGNSGGPLLNLKGQVVGINSQIISPSGASAGIGFAVSASTVQRVTPRLIAQGYYPHPWLGADMVALTTQIVQVLRDAGIEVPVEEGLLVVDTTARGPADQAGVRGPQQWVRMWRSQLPAGEDIITAIDGQLVKDLQTLTVYLETKSIGDTVTLTIRRGSKDLSISVTLGEAPQQ